VTVTNYVTITNTVSADTNGNVVTIITGDGVNTNTSATDKTSWELTFGASGISDTKTRDSSGDLDVSLEASPFSFNRSIWVGGEQAITLNSGFSGFSDLFAEYSFDIYKDKVYLNPGWDIRATYASSDQTSFGTGPHVSLQYFFFNDAFVYGQVNYLFESKNDDGFLYSAGLGVTF
jgi:hypothetical protein